MHTIMSTLQHDHHQFQSLIELVHRQINAFKAGQSSDCIWLIDGMQLIRRSLDTLHKPVEDVFQERLLLKSGRAYHLLKPLLRDDYLRFSEHSDRFIETLDGVMHGSVTSREAPVVYGEQAIADLYRQISFEERAVFPYANDILSIDDWLLLDSDIQNWKESTMIENGLKNDYRNLIQRLNTTTH